MTMKIAIIQMDIAFGDPEANRAEAERKVQEAAREKVDVIVLPELWTTGYDLSRFDEIAEKMDGPTHRLLKELCKKYKLAILGSVAEVQGENYYNTLVGYNSEGTRILHYRKAHLFRLMNEEKYLESGDTKGNFSILNHKAAGVICYDIRFPEWMRTHMLDGSKALFVVAEWPKPRVDHWRSLLISRAIENQCFVIACNRVGSDDNNRFGGHSMVIDPWGNIVAEAGGHEEILYAEVDLSDVEEIREQIPIFQDRRPSLYE
ncbi:carbon-nitrogen family hydrolase [Halobacillus yeomjeoni]|uniref:Carbon-nitrogen family hydrolase n=1 Tax=Halobacillus yeomjeoni TaxID=311194 RepID=A0A931MWU5_9BACI|nr:carbon-nitrogen family hydrolase [Halobacillus yeomjeoni]MBH0231614.1 carbon-nitrogen family hydrolase [Halobacillus yeomjeoni]